MSCRWFPSSRLWIQVRCKQHAWPLPRYKVHLKRTDRHLEHHHGATNFRSKRNIRYGYFRYGSNHLGENLSLWKRHYQEPDWNPFLGLWKGRTFKLFCQKIGTTAGIQKPDIRKPDIQKPDVLKVGLYNSKTGENDQFSNVFVLRHGLA